MRGDIATAFGRPRDCASPDARLCDLMALTAWFGSDLLALGEIQDRFEHRARSKEVVKPEVTVREIVRGVAAQQGDAK